LVRIFHWSLVVGFIAAYASGDEWDLLHEVVGYGIVALLAVRILWGFIGSRHARFRNFIHRPRTVLMFLHSSIRLEAPRYLGHNPAGGAMVIALLVAIMCICLTGILLTTDAYGHAKWLEELHEVLANGTIVLIVLHIGGVVLASIEHKENLVSAMFTGKKRLRDR
jgi:cytochrome b